MIDCSCNCFFLSFVLSFFPSLFLSFIFSPFRPFTRQPIKMMQPHSHISATGESDKAKSGRRVLTSNRLYTVAVQCFGLRLSTTILAQMSHIELDGVVSQPAVMIHQYSVRLLSVCRPIESYVCLFFSFYFCPGPNTLSAKGGQDMNTLLSFGSLVAKQRFIPNNFTNLC